MELSKLRKIRDFADVIGGSIILLAVPCSIVAWIWIGEWRYLSALVVIFILTIWISFAVERKIEVRKMSRRIGARREC